MDDPTSIPELLRRALVSKRVSERAASMYMGLAPNAVNMWVKRGRNPDPDSCRLIAKWAGYPEEFVLQLAGHLSGMANVPPVGNRAPIRIVVVGEKLCVAAGVVPSVRLMRSRLLAPVHRIVAR